MSENTTAEKREKLNQKEEELLRFISEHLQSNGYSPTVREICDYMHIHSTSTAHKYLCRLEEKGYIVRKMKNSRSASHVMRVCSEGQNKTEQERSLAREERNETREKAVVIPLLGQVAAGQPIQADQCHDGYVAFSVNTRQYEESTLFALQIHGNSMNEIGIMNGDTVIVTQTETVVNGEIVIALIGEEATCKRFFREKDGRIRLQPENHTMEPIYVPTCRILGKVIASFRIF